MSRQVVAPFQAAVREAAAGSRLAALTAVLAQDLQTGVWEPGPLERTLAGRLLVACAGDGQLTRDRVRATLEEGAIALTYAGGGRLAWLLAQLMEEAQGPAAAPAAALALLEQVAQPGGTDGAGH